MTRAQQLRAELKVARTSRSTARWSSDPGPRGGETARFRPMAQRLRDVNIRAGRIRAFDPTLAAAANLGVP